MHERHLRERAAAGAPQDMPLPIGHSQTISAPHMHATALELLADRLQPGANVLDVGSGAQPALMERQLPLSCAVAAAACHKRLRCPAMLYGRCCMSTRGLSMLCLSSKCPVHEVHI